MTGLKRLEDHYFLCLPITSINHPITDVVNKGNLTYAPSLLIKRPNNSDCHCKECNNIDKKTFVCQRCNKKYHKSCYALKNNDKRSLCIYCQHHIVSLYTNSLKEYFDVITTNINESVDISTNYRNKPDNKTISFGERYREKMKEAENVTNRLQILRNGIEQSIQNITDHIKVMSEN